MRRLRLPAISALLMISAELLLRRRTLENTQRTLARMARMALARPQPEEAAWAIAAAARRLPFKTTCLHEALAGEALLKAAGHDCTLRIGARKHKNGHAFHAWLEADGETIIGASAEGHTILEGQGAWTS
jgi:hypothetical protein